MGDARYRRGYLHRDRTGDRPVDRGLSSEQMAMILIKIGIVIMMLSAAWLVATHA